MDSDRIILEGSMRNDSSGTTGKSVRTNYFFHTLYQVVTLLTPLLTTPYITRVLLPEGVGQYSFYYTYVQYFVIVGNLGFSTYGQIQIARVSDDIGRRSQIFWEIFIMRLCLYGICSLIYITLCLLSENRVLMLILFGLMISGTIDVSWLYFGMGDYKSVSLRNMLVKAISIVGIFVFVKTKSDVPVYAAVLTLSGLFGSLIVWPGVKKFVITPRGKLNCLSHLKPAMVYFLPNIATMIYTMIDKTMIGIITGSEAQNGYYEEAHKIEQILVQFLLSIGVVYRSQMAKLFEKKDEARIRESIDKAMEIVLFTSFPICFGLIAVSRDLVGWFLGLDFLPSIPILRIFSSLLLIISISNCMSNMYLIVADKMKFFLIGTYAAAGINICCNLLMIPVWNAVGAAIASVISELSMLVVFYVYSRQYFAMRFFKKHLFRYFVFASVMLAAVLAEAQFLKPYLISSLLIETATGAIVYVALLLIIKDETLFEIIRTAIYKIRNR